MTPWEVLEKFGLPIATVIAFGYFIWKQQHWIQKELVEDLDDAFKRLEGIIIKLIDQQKVTQLDVKHIKGYINGIKDIIVQLEVEKKERK